MVEQPSFGKSAYAAVDGIKYNTQQIFQTPEREIMRGTMSTSSDIAIDRNGRCFNGVRANFNLDIDRQTKLSYVLP
jgi:hypothetical protein